MTRLRSKLPQSLCRRARLLLLGLLLVKSAALVAAEEDREMVVHPPGIDLPAGEGRNLVLTACTRCHDLKGLSAYSGYWNLARWRSMVETMVKNGAVLDDGQINIVAAYLAEHFGTPGDALRSGSESTHQQAEH